MTLELPDTYVSAPIAYVPINMALMPMLQGAIDRLFDELLWVSDEQYHAAHAALTELRIHMASQPTVGAGYVLIGPSSGADATPAFRRLMFVDLPAIAYSQLTGIPTEFSPTMHALNHSEFGSDPLTPGAIGAALAVHTHVISYSSLSGIPSSFVPSLHASTHNSGGTDPISPTSIGAANLAHTHPWNNISGAPATYAPSAHASTHAAAGSDPVTPGAIGAATAGHTHASEAWTAITLVNSWVNFGSGYNTAAFFKDPVGVVHLRGLIRSGTTTAGTLLFTLPAGYRPAAIELFNVQTLVSSTYTIGRVDINTSGQAIFQTGGNTYLSLDGLTFRAT